MKTVGITVKAPPPPLPLEFLGGGVGILLYRGVKNAHFNKHRKQYELSPTLEKIVYAVLQMVEAQRYKPEGFDS